MEKIRIIRFVRSCYTKRDGSGLILLCVVFLICFRLLCMPFSEPVQRAAIDRFHLTTDSFVSWASQQCIPPMYNLENQYWFAHRPLSAEELVANPADDIEYGYINHFPIRKVTFAGSRYRCFRDDPNGWLYLKSTYRGTVQVAAWRIEPSNDGELKMLPADYPVRAPGVEAANRP